MIVKMKAYEKAAIESCRRYKKNWDHFCIATSAWLEGYNSKASGTEEVEVEFKDGDHQLNSKTRFPLTKENLIIALNTFFDCEIEDIRVSRKNNEISGQFFIRDKNGL